MACSLIWTLGPTADAHEQPVVAPVAADSADVARERRGPQHGRRAAEDRAARGGERVLEALVRVELGPGLAPRHRLENDVASREAVEPRDRLLRKLRVAVREPREGVAAADALHRVRRRRVRSSCHVADPGLVDRRVAPAGPRRHDEHGPPVVALVWDADGDEEVSAAGSHVKGVVLARDLPHLSHLAIRARQEKVPLAATEDANSLAYARSLLGKNVALKVEPDGKVSLAEAAADVAAAGADEDASSAFIPFVGSSSSEGESGDGFWRAVRELWRRDVALGLARCVAGDEVVGNGCIDGAASWDDARKRSHRDAYANVRPMDRDERALERPKPFSDDCSQTEVVALDCEMVGVGDGGLESMLAQVCVLNEHGNALYCSYSRAYKKVTDYRTHVSGILPRHVDSSAPEFAKVRADVAALIRGRIVVGHALENDFQALQLHHPRDDVRDTAVWRPLLRPPRFARPRKLRHLARDFCALRIQSGDAAHDPAEDALAALAVYRKFRENWEGQVASAKLGRGSTAPP